MSNYYIYSENNGHYIGSIFAETAEEAKRKYLKLLINSNYGRVRNFTLPDVAVSVVAPWDVHQETDYESMYNAELWKRKRAEERVGEWKVTSAITVIVLVAVCLANWMW